MRLDNNMFLNFDLLGLFEYLHKITWHSRLITLE